MQMMNNREDTKWKNQNLHFELLSMFGGDY